ncbi:hypothetical protein [Haloplanus salilacus]|uniref:hypothetical protein n=1 Tax=Haloplanus salilacus TaxID=2949994 RepID=UPI0030D447AE
MGPSLFGGVAMLAGWLGLRLVVSAVLDGNVARAAGVVAAALLAVLSRRYLLAVLATNLTDPLWSRYSRRGLVTGSLFGALVLFGSAQVHPVAPFAVVVAGWVPVVLTAGFPTSGRADRVAGTLTVDGTGIPPDSVRTVRAVTIDTVAVCWLSYTRGVPTAPRLVLVPSDYLDTVSTLLGTGAAASNRDHSTLGRPERLVAGLFGFGLVAAGPVLWVLLPAGDGQVVALYAGATFGLLGVVLLRYAYTA